MSGDGYSVAGEPLTAREMEMLEVERLRFKFSGAKENEVAERFGISLVLFLAQINRLIERREALAYDAQLVRRLRALRTARRAARTGRRLGDTRGESGSCD